MLIITLNQQFRRVTIVSHTCQIYICFPCLMTILMFHTVLISYLFMSIIFYPMFIGLVYFIFFYKFSFAIISSTLYCFPVAFVVLISMQLCIYMCMCLHACSCMYSRYYSAIKIFLIHFLLLTFMVNNHI